jgi:hypothetical protein
VECAQLSRSVEKGAVFIGGFQCFSVSYFDAVEHFGADGTLPEFAVSLHIDLNHVFAAPGDAALQMIAPSLHPGHFAITEQLAEPFVFTVFMTVLFLAEGCSNLQRTGEGQGMNIRLPSRNAFIIYRTG